MCVSANHQQIKSYDPEKEFVVVFQAAGVCGADICKPSVGPPEMAQHVSAHDSCLIKRFVTDSSAIGCVCTDLNRRGTGIIKHAASADG